MFLGECSSCMIQIKDEAERMYNFTPRQDALLKLEKWHELFIEYNSHTNLMSKNDVSVLYEKHALDSLSIVLYEGFKDNITLLDVGCGGGFPSVILSIFFPNIRVFAMDSISKKINFIFLVKEKLQLDNLFPVLSRAENYPPVNADIIVSRAVGKIDEIWSFSKRHLKQGGSFVSYKALSARDEAQAAEKRFKELKNPLFLSYKLPTAENYTRELVVFKTIQTR